MSNVLNIGMQSSILLLLALPMTLIIMSEGLDLSMGAVLSARRRRPGDAVVATGVHAAAALAAALAVGLAFGVRNGLLVARARHSAVRGDARHARDRAGPRARGHRRAERRRHRRPACRQLYASTLAGLPFSDRGRGVGLRRVPFRCSITRGSAPTSSPSAATARRSGSRACDVISYHIASMRLAGDGRLRRAAADRPDELGHPTAGIGHGVRRHRGGGGRRHVVRARQWLAAGTLLGVLAVGVLKNGLNVMAVPSSLRSPASACW